MGFFLKTDELTGDGVRRVLAEVLDDATYQLIDGHRPREERFHQARKQLKKARAVLRLVRPSIGKKIYRRENERLRDCGRALAAARDADVLGKTLATLERELPEAEQFEPAVAEWRSQTLASFSHHPSELVRARENLEQARKAITSLVVEEKRGDEIARGATRVYQRGKKGMQLAYLSPSDTSFHEWRKQVKYYRHVLALLRKLSVPSLEATGKVLHELSNLLGEDHDLAVLRQVLDSEKSARAKPLLEKIAARQAELRQKAYPLGIRLFSEPRSDFAERIGVFWKDWRRGRNEEGAYLSLLSQ